MPNTPAGNINLQRKLGPADGQIIALEPTCGYEWAIWEALDTASYDVRQVGAAHVRAFSRATDALAKTDPIDARLIADYIAFRPDFGRRLPTEELCHLNALSTKRRQLMELRKRLKCQIKQHANDLIVTLDTELLELLSRQIKGLEDAIHAQIINDPQMKQHATILRSISGIGPVLCATLIAEMPELGMFGDKKDAGLSGVAPMNRENGRMDGRRSIKGGRYIIRSLLYQAALVASKHNKTLNAFANRLKAKGKAHKVVLITVARKLLTIANVLMAKNKQASRS